MRRVFYSFHYDRDISRVSRVRNSGLTKNVLAANRIIDHADWEKIKRQGPGTIQNWIEDQLSGAGVTAVLIGAETHMRPWVLYEIQRSYELGKGIMGVRIHNMKDWDGSIDPCGINPLDIVKYKDANGPFTTDRPLSAKFRTYDWVLNDGYNNLYSWVEEAAQIANR